MMSARWSKAALALVACAALGRLYAQDPAPWQHEYRGTEATGPQVLALWQFEPGRETEDSSGHGHRLSLRGRSVFAPEGRFGSCLESFAVDPKVQDAPVGASAADSAALSPPGAFTLELWLKPKAEMLQTGIVYLVDKKYYAYAKDVPEANTDYMLYLQRRGDGVFVLTASLGFGKDSVWGSSRSFGLVAGRWYHLAYSYDGVGTGRFYVDGVYQGKAVHAGRGAVTPGRHALVLGDRVGSVYAGCAGFLDEVRLSAGVLPWCSGDVEVSVRSSRTVFRRYESGAAVAVQVDNDTGSALSAVRAQVSCGGALREEALGDLAPGESRTLSAPVDTRLKPGLYPLTVVMTATGDHGEVRREARVDVRLVARPTPLRMPVVMWGSGEIEKLQDIGFTHEVQGLQDFGRIWDAGQPTAALEPDGVTRQAEMLNDHLARGIAVCDSLSPGPWVTRDPARSEYLRVDRSGKPCQPANTSASHPAVQRFAYNVGAAVAQTFGAFPALDMALVHTEVRDGTAISYHDYELKAARAALGCDIPREARGKNGVNYSQLRDVPADRVVPDDYPLLRFYRWFWKDGDGWNPLHTQVHAGLKSTGRQDIVTFFDPAVRVPALWGSGGGVDVISQWTYSYPDPLKIGQATDELFAMADGRPGQQVMKMTQIIWYRSQTAPELPKDESARAAWEKEIPDAKFITIAPDHLREAFWSKLSRPVRGIMYHGWGSLFPAPQGSYRCTNSQTREVLQELLATVVQPLGPTLLQVPDPQTDIALLESFAAQMLAGRGTYGWGQSWEARMHLILQWAALQPRILYDEHVLRDGLAPYKVLVLPCCDVLTAGVVTAIKDFQRRGGIVVGDEFLCPAIAPDIQIASCGDRGDAQERKAELLAAAARLRAELDPFYTRYADSADPEVVPRRRRYGSTDYLFAVNDHRTYGDYVGQHRKVMEKGLPSRALLTLRRPAGTVYDLVAHQEVPAEAVHGTLAVPLEFGPGDGRLLMVTARPIRDVVCEVPRRVARGGTLPVSVRVRAGRWGGTVDAVVPLEVKVLDAAGEAAEGSGYYGARDGRLALRLDIAPNDTPGRWRIAVTELASGKQVEAAFAVE
jgi:hypothetical protein